MGYVSFDVGEGSFVVGRSLLRRKFVAQGDAFFFVSVRVLRARGRMLVVRVWFLLFFIFGPRVCVFQGGSEAAARLAARLQWEAVFCVLLQCLYHGKSAPTLF